MEFRILPLKVKRGVPQKLDTNDNPTLQEWIDRVNHFLVKRRGLDLHDLPDVDYRKWYEARVRPIRAANKFIAAINKGLLD